MITRLIAAVHSLEDAAAHAPPFLPLLGEPAGGRASAAGGAVPASVPPSIPSRWVDHSRGALAAEDELWTLLRGALAVLLGGATGVAGWVLLRAPVLGLDPRYVLAARHETAEQRLFVYGCFGAGALLAGLVAARWRVPVAALTAAATYLAVVAEVQHLPRNPDLFKLPERGYVARSAEVLGVGAAAGAVGAGLAGLGRRRPRRRPLPDGRTFRERG